MKIPYTIQIDGTDNGGFIVKVGCRTLTYKSQENLLDALGEYLATPLVVADEYAKTFGWTGCDPSDPSAIQLAPQPGPNRGPGAALPEDATEIRGSR